MAQHRGRVRGGRPDRDAQLAGFRDPDGIRPLVVGRLDDAWVLASETCALDLIGATPRARARARRAGRHRRARRPLPRRPSPRARRVALHLRVHLLRPPRLARWRARRCTTSRRRMGERLARRGAGRGRRRDRRARLGHAGRASATPSAAASRSARAWSRTATSAARSSSPTRALRERGVKLKFNALRSVLDGQRVVVVDDSIVRGSTTAQARARCCSRRARVEVHLRISSPPIVSPCFYGIDMADQDAADRRRPQRRGGARAARAPPRSPTSRWTASAGDRQPGRELLPRLPDRRVPDRDPRRHAALQAALRAAPAAAQPR